MSRHPQLRVADAKPFDFSAEYFFEHVMPEVLEARRGEARSLGGRIGFVVGQRQWVVDLDCARVRGDAHATAVADDDALDAVFCASPERFAALMRGGVAAGGGALQLWSGDHDVVTALFIVMSGL